MITRNIGRPSIVAIRASPSIRADYQRAPAESERPIVALNARGGETQIIRF
jgi:hypothetical protein